LKVTREVRGEVLPLLGHAQGLDLSRVEEHEALGGERREPVGVAGEVRLTLHGMRGEQ
jgi:hypothetical protein